ncbi:MAG: amidohydrolase family protein [Polyangiaceae bacterium]|nr:amidohydrolase family protein [Polyangiaceae bacterium]
MPIVLRAWLPAVMLALAGGCDPGNGDNSDPLPLPSGGAGGGGGEQVGGGGSPSNGGSGGIGPSGGGGEGGQVSTGGGGSGEGACDSGGPVLETAGATDAYLLKGTLLLPGGPTEGELLIAGNLIACVGASCSGEPEADGATVIDTKGVIAPGLIDAHNHILFDIFDEDDWAPTQTYTNHDQWPNDDRYGAMVDAKQYLAGEGSSPVDFGCELDKYGEIKALVAGTTSVQGSPGATNRGCYRTVARTIDQTYNGLPDDNMQTATVFPSTSSADGVCNNFNDGDTTAYVIHIGEGVDATARDEFNDLFTVTSTDGCLYDDKTTIVHGTALDDAQLTTMGDNGMSLVWSPRSNVFLYGAGTDTSKTTNIPKALAEGINVAIAPDWSIGGSQNMLDELRYADFVDDAEFGNMLDSRDLFEMATSHAAIALGVEAYVGSLVEGKRADIAVFLPSGADPYEAVLAASPREVTLVFVDGRLLYGDADLVDVGPSDGICETVDMCCRDKFLCIAQSGGSAADMLGQTLADIQQALGDAMTDYDDLNLTEWDFAPITPVVKCP